MKSRIAGASKQNWLTISNCKPGRFRRRESFCERPVELVVADPRMALVELGDADAADAAAAQDAVVDDVERTARKNGSSFVAVAGNDQDMVDLGFAVEPRQEIVERLSAPEVAHPDPPALVRGRPPAWPSQRRGQPSAGRFGIALGQIHARRA